MDKLLAEMNNLKHVKRDSKSLAHYAATISVFVNDMKTRLHRVGGVRSSVLHVSSFIKARSCPKSENQDKRRRVRQTYSQTV